MGSAVQRRALLGILPVLLLTGCGYVGDPLPPALYIPLPVADLSAAQQEGKLAVRFTLPARTTEDLPTEASPEVDLRAAVWENRPWDEGIWEREAATLPTPPPEGAAVDALIDAAPFAGKRILLRVRVAGKLGRFSAWSNPVALRVLPTPAEIHGLAVVSAPEGVLVSWTLPAQPTPGMLTEIFRKAPADHDFTRLDAVPGDRWEDRGARFGDSYVYQVRERLERDEIHYTGAFLGPLAITPVDTFPPAVPADVTAVAGAAGVELSWARNQESDFLEYRIYRSAAGSEFQPVGEPTPTPTFSDVTAPRAVPLRYRITSVDEKGNESAPFNAVEITLP
ncbi:MAG: hypothetical protein IT170_09195 [Bryobacterales bacterium]|nr:hypothetical protein [Bryobacterales bacterium]